MTDKQKQILQLNEHLLIQGIPFAAYSLPNSTEVFHVVQDGEISGGLNFSNPGNGFYVHPFSTEKSKSFFIRADHFVRNGNIDLSYFSQVRKQIDTSYEQGETSRQEHLQNILLAKERIDHGELEKVVLSRIKKVKQKDSSIGELFNALTDRHPGAFVFLLSSPLSGVWLGASPEIFLEKNETDTNVCSLAGTIANKRSDEDWSEKEKTEQRIVTSFLADRLKELNLDYERKGPYSFNAGNVKHLRTDFRISGKLDLQAFIEKMHPTPAVAGVPKEKAIQIIESLEKHNRLYYTGFLGPIIDEEINFYVNLRSMHVTKEFYYLYLGGGITAQSAPEKEWEETELKAQTLLAVIENLQTFG